MERVRWKRMRITTQGASCFPPFLPAILAYLPASSLFFHFSHSSFMSRLSIGKDSLSHDSLSFHVLPFFSLFLHVSPLYGRRQQTTNQISFVIQFALFIFAFATNRFRIAANNTAAQSCTDLSKKPDRKLSPLVTIPVRVVFADCGARP